MADEVDDRVVAMHFDNAAFEAKISETIKSLSKLQSTLDLTNSVKGLSNLDVGNANASLNSMASSVENISSKFSAMGVVAFSVISNITNKAVDAGLRFAKSFALGPMTDGFGEMETKIGSIQTILANTSRYGTGLDEVQANLQALNEYSDKTIYNFGEMTKNIGLFTNAGIKVGDATSMIKGFSNAAAASGTTAEGAAGAAYQLSQALSAGTIKLMDWRSLTNVGMGNKNMQTGIIEIAKAMGTLDTAGLKAEDVQAHFNETLEKGWLTADVMSNYLKIMAGDMDEAKLKALGLSSEMIKTFQAQQKTAEDAATKVRTWTQLVGTVKEAIGSGWSETFEILLGNFDQATELFTGINNAVGKFVGNISDARNNVLRAWADFGSRTELLNALKDIFGSLGRVIDAFRFSFSQIFQPESAATLVKMTASFADFAEWLRKTTENILPHLVNLFGVVFAVINLGKNIIIGITHLFVDLFKALIPDRAGTNVIGFFGNLSGALIRVLQAISNGGLPKFFELLHKLLIPVAKAIGTVTGAIIDFFFAFKYSDFMAGVLKQLEKVADLIVRLEQVAKQAFDVMFHGSFKGGPLSEDSKLVDTLFDIRDALERVMGIARQFFDVIFRGDFTGGPLQEDSKTIDVLFDMREAFERLFNTIKSVKLGAAVKNIGDTFSNLKDKISDFFDVFDKSDKVDQATKKLVDLDRKSRILISAVTSKELGDGPLNLGTDSVDEMDKQTSTFQNFIQKIKDLVSGFVDALQNLGGAIASIAKVIKEAIGDFFLGSKMVDNKSGFQVLVDTINTILFTGILISVMKFVKSFKKLVDSADGVFKQLGNTLKNFGKESKPTQLVKIAIALTLIAGSLTVLAGIDKDKLVTSLEAMTAAFVGLFAMMKALDKFIKNPAQIQKTATVLIAIGISMKFLAQAMAIMSQLSWEEIAKGLVGVSGAMVALGFAVGLMKHQVNMSTAVVVLAIATSTFLLAKAVEMFAKFNWGELAKGLVAMTIALSIIGNTVGQMGPGLILAAPGVFILVLALVKMADAILSFAAIPMGKLVKGLLSIGVAMGMIAGTVGSLPPSFFLVAAGMPRFAKGLLVIVDAVNKMGSLKLGTMVKGILAIDIMLGTIVAAVTAMTGALAGAAALVVVSGALAILAITVQKLGNTDLKVLAIGLGAIAAVFALLGGAALLLTPVLPSLIALAIAIEMIGKAFLFFGIGAGLTIAAFGYLAKTSQDNISHIIAAIEKFVKAIPHFFEVFIAALAESSKGIVQSFDTIATSIEQIIIRALEIALKTIPKFAQVVDLAITEILHLFANRMVDFIEIGFMFIKAVGKGLLDNIGELTIMAVGIITRFLAVLADNAPSLVDSGVRLILAFLDGIGSRISDIIAAGTDLLVKFLFGVYQSLDLITDVVTSIVANFVINMAQNYQRMVDVGAMVIIKLLEGIQRDTQKVIDKGVEVVLKFIQGLGKATLDLTNGAAKLLEDFLNGLATAIRTHSKEINKAGLNVAEAILEGMTGGLLDPKNVTKVVDAAIGMGKKVIDGVKGIFDSHSPSKVFERIALDTGAGMAIGFDKDSLAQNSAVRQAERIVAAFQDTLGRVPDSLDGMDEFHPVITPVLDLTKVQAGARGLNGLMTQPSITPNVSLAQAKLISTTAESTQTPVDVPSGPTEVNFVQNINSPKALSTNDIYRNTKSQIALAKEELGI